MYGLKLGCYFCMDTRIQVESAAHYFGKHHPYPQSKGHNAGSKIKKGQLLSIKTLALFELFSLPSELLLPRFANCNLSSPVLLILLGIEGEMAQLAHIKQSNGWTVAPPHLPLWCPRSVMGHPPPACPSLGTKLYIEPIVLQYRNMFHDVYIYIYIYMHVSLCLFKLIYMYMYMHVYVYMYIYIYIYICGDACINIYVKKYVCMHA